MAVVITVAASPAPFRSADGTGCRGPRRTSPCERGRAPRARSDRWTAADPDVGRSFLNDRVAGGAVTPARGRMAVDEHAVAALGDHGTNGMVVAVDRIEVGTGSRATVDEDVGRARPRNLALKRSGEGQAADELADPGPSHRAACDHRPPISTGTETGAVTAARVANAPPMSTPATSRPSDGECDIGSCRRAAASGISRRVRHPRRLGSASWRHAR